MTNITHLINPDFFGLHPNRPWVATTGYLEFLRVQQCFFGGAVVLDILNEGGGDYWGVGTYAYDDEPMVSDEVYRLSPGVVQEILRETFRELSCLDNRRDLRRLAARRRQEAKPKVHTLPGAWTRSGNDEQVELP